MKKALLLSCFISVSLYAFPDENDTPKTPAVLTLQQTIPLTYPDDDIFDSAPYQYPTIIDQISWKNVVTIIQKLNVIIVDGFGPMGIADKGLKQIEG